MNEIRPERCSGDGCVGDGVQQKVPFLPPRLVFSFSRAVHRRGVGVEVRSTSTDVEVNASSLKSISGCSNASLICVIPVRLGFMFAVRFRETQSFPYENLVVRRCRDDAMENFPCASTRMKLFVFLPSRNILSILHKKYSFDCCHDYSDSMLYELCYCVALLCNAYDGVFGLLETLEIFSLKVEIEKANSSWIL